MHKEYSKHLLQIESSLEKLLNLLSNNFTYVSILSTDCKGKRIYTSNKETKVSDSSWQEKGTVVRVYNGEFYSEFSFSGLCNPEKMYNQIINSSDVNELLTKSIYIKNVNYPCIKEEKKEADFERMDDYEEPNIAEIVDTSKTLIENAMEENEYIINAYVIVEYLKVSKLFISSNKKLRQVYSWANANYGCVTNRDDNYQSYYEGSSSHNVKEAIAKMSAKIKDLGKTASDLLDSTKIEPGEYDCITTPIVTGLIAHEAFGHGVEMDMFVKNRAIAVNYMYKQVGSNLITMHEGAKPHIDVSSYFFDDEGVEAHDTIEIKNGTLVGGIADTLAALNLKIEPTGNGKRENYSHKAYTRMTNTYFESGSSTVEEMIASIKYGFLIDGEISGMEDPKNWGIQCICAIGREIKNGKLTGRCVSPLILSGNVIDLLKSISMVSKDFELYGSGGCGKGYKEWVKTSIGGPYLKAKVKLG